MKLRLAIAMTLALATAAHAETPRPLFPWLRLFQISAPATTFREDSAHVSGHYGNFVLAVRNDAGTTLCDTTGDYCAFQVDSTGQLRVVAPLPSGAATDRSTAAAPFAVRLTDGTSFYQALTDTQLRASAVPVSAAQLPATLVSGRLDVNLGATITVPVSGTFWQATQPISASTLPLPTGASTDRTTAAGPSSGRLSDGAAFYDATKTGQLPAALDGGGGLKTHEQGTAAISAASLPLPGGASTETTLALIKAKTDNLDVALSTRTKSADSQTVTGTVTANQGGAPWTGRIQDGSGATLAAVTASNALKTDGSAVTQPVNGTVTANAGSGTFTVSGTVTANAGTGTLATDPVDRAARLLGHVTVDNATIPITAAALPLSSNAAQEAGGNLATIATKDTSIESKLPTPVNNAQPVIVQQTLIQAPPVLSARVLANPLLLRAAMQQYCRLMLCPPGSF